MIGLVSVIARFIEREGYDGEAELICASEDEGKSVVFSGIGVTPRTMSCINDSSSLEIADDLERAAIGAPRSRNSR
jgi:hypothetical protein